MSVDSGSFANRRTGSIVNNPWLDGMLPPRRKARAAGDLLPVDSGVSNPPARGSEAGESERAVEDERTIGGIQHGTAQAQTG